MQNRFSLIFLVMPTDNVTKPVGLSYVLQQLIPISSSNFFDASASGRPLLWHITRQQDKPKSQRFRRYPDKLRICRALAPSQLMIHVSNNDPATAIRPQLATAMQQRHTVGTAGYGQQQPILGTMTLTIGEASRQCVQEFNTVTHESRQSERGAKAGR
jgi:hypothetical protein